MNLSVNNPNFSVIMPVGCNASCDFCYWDKSEGLTLERFERVINELPASFEQCSITGGEPTIAGDLAAWIRVANKRFKKVILNTNGYLLTKDIVQSVDHVNISRHHYDETVNKQIFNATTVPTTAGISDFCMMGDVTLNCYLEDEFSDRTFIANYIKYAKYVGAKVAFRKNYSNLKILKNIDTASTLVDQHSCGACLHRYHLIHEVDVTFKYSVKETYEHMNGIYELILHPDGTLSYDWGGAHSIELSQLSCLEYVDSSHALTMPVDTFKKCESITELNLEEFNLGLIRNVETQGCGSHGCHAPTPKPRTAYIKSLISDISQLGNDGRGCGSGGCG